MSHNLKFGLTYLVLFSCLLLSIGATHASEKEVKPVRPREVIKEEKYQHKLPKIKKKFQCNPKHDIFHQPSCIIV